MAIEHIPEESLERYAMGAVAGETIAEVETHIAACRLCQRRLAETRHFLDIFCAAAVESDARPLGRMTGMRVHGGALRAAVAAAAAAILIFFLTAGRHSGELAPATVMMETMRGLETTARAPAGRACVLVFDTPPSVIGSNSEVQVVDRGGNSIVFAPGKWVRGRLTAVIGQLARGSYWVRVYRKPTQQLIAEYSLAVD